MDFVSWVEVRLKLVGRTAFGHQFRGSSALHAVRMLVQDTNNLLLTGKKNGYDHINKDSSTSASTCNSRTLR
ncbi:hypothetical protein Tsubulata_029419, partial [Turnera subulata]